MRARPRSSIPTSHVLRRAADAVGQHLAQVADWGFSGRRAGQYAVDVDVDDVVVAVLHDAGFAVVSEESGRSGDGDRIVVVDPLDGSTNASRGIPWFATSLCIVDDDGPAVALVANQATGERFEAVRGEGAWVDGRRLVPSGRTSLDGAVIGISGLPASGTAWGWWQFRALGAAALDLGLRRRRQPRRVGRHERRRARLLGLSRRRVCCAPRPVPVWSTSANATSSPSTPPNGALRSPRRRRRCSTSCSATVADDDRRRACRHRSGHGAGGRRAHDARPASSTSTAPS